MGFASSLLGSMIDTFRSVGAYSDKNGTVILTGFPYDAFKRFLKKFYNVGSFMERFTIRTWAKSVIIHEFFVPEMIYLLQEGADQGFINRGRARTLIESLYKNTWFGTSRQPVQSAVDLSKLNELNFTPLPHQLEFIKDVYWQKKIQYQLKGFLLSLDQGLGKLLPNNTPIKTPHGWKNIGDIQVGDVVTAVDGGTTTVTGVYPQGVKPVFRLTFEDGRWVDAGAEHLWTVRRRTGWDYETVTMSTREMIDWKLAHRDAVFRIPIAESEQVDDLPLPIDPYLLGVLLGDGSIASKGLTIYSDDEVIERVQERNPDLNIGVHIDPTKNVSWYRRGRISMNTEAGQQLKRQLDAYGLIGTHALTKFIPTEYLYGSHEQRLELLRGLLDTDGSVNDPLKSVGRTGKHGSSGTIEFNTISPNLAKGVQYLVRSLGGKCSMTDRITFFTYKGEKKAGQRSYRVRIHMKHPDEIFTLSRKRCRLAHETQYSKFWDLRLDSIVPLPDKVECTCIAVDHPSHLYIAQDFIVTHNTLTSIFLSHCLSKKHTVVIGPLSVAANVWPQEITNAFKSPKKIWTVNQDPNQIDLKTDFVVMNYEAMGKLTPYIKKAFKDPDDLMIVVDEVHNCKDINSQRTEALINLVEVTGCRDNLLMSGTPVKALGVEAMPIFKLLDSYFNDKVMAEVKQLCRYPKVMNDLLRNRLGLMMFRKLKSEVLQLPPKHQIDLLVKTPDRKEYTLKEVRKKMEAYRKEREIFYRDRMSIFEAQYRECIDLFKLTPTYKNNPAAFREYEDQVRKIKKYGHSFEMSPVVEASNKFEKNVIIPAIPQSKRNQFRNAKSAVKYVDLKILGEILGNLLNQLRMEMTSGLVGKEVLEIIRKAEKKTILFSSYSDTIDLAREVCTRAGMKPLCITGENSNQAKELVARFKEDPTLNPLIASIKVMSTGHTIICANTVIFLNVPFRSVDYDQASDRVYRYGQDTDVYIYKLILDTGEEPNLSTRMHDIIAWSKNEFNAIVGDDELDIATQATVTHQINKFMAGNESFMETYTELLKPYLCKFGF